MLEVEKAKIKAFWGARGSQQYERYFDLPLIIGQSRRRAFSQIKESLCQRLQMWKGFLLSQGGKEILLKAMALVIPTFTMSVFKLSTFLYTEFESLMAKFWWGHNCDKDKTHWISWDKLCKLKNKGGLYFKNLHDFNLSILAKQGWRILQNEISLLSRIFKAKYFPNVSFFDAPLDHYPLYVWRGIWKATCWLQKGCLYRIGDRSRVKIWKDP